MTESRSAEGAGDEGSTPREGRLCDHCAYHHADHGNDGNLNQINGSLIVSFNFFFSDLRIPLLLISGEAERTQGKEV